MGNLLQLLLSSALLAALLQTKNSKASSLPTPKTEDDVIPDRSYSYTTNSEENFAEVDDLNPMAQMFPSLIELEKMLSGENAKYKTFFGTDYIPPSHNVSKRFMKEEYGELLCDHETKILYPQKALNANSNWLSIVQLSPYKQGIKVELCRRVGSQCKMTENLPNRYTAICKQNFIYRKLLAISPTEGTLKTDYFKIPSCCQCITIATAAKLPKEDLVLVNEIHFHNPNCEDFFSESYSFCTKVRGYPQLNTWDPSKKRELSTYEPFFTEDIAEPPIRATGILEIEPHEEPLCATYSDVIYPEAAMTRDSNWLLVVNNYLQYKQGLRVDFCSHQGSQSFLQESLPNGYTAKCIQRYVFRPLIAISPNGTFIKEYFKIPSCCQCVVTPP